MALSLAAGLWSGAGAPAAAEDTPVASASKTTDYEERGRALVDVQGNKRVDATTVRSYFHASPDGRLDEAARDAALKALIETHLFDTV